MKNVVFRLNAKERDHLYRHQMSSNYVTWVACGAAIIVFQVLMLISSLSYIGPSVKANRYRMLYIGLIVITAVAEFLLTRFKKKRNTPRLFYNTMNLYMLLVMLWAVGIVSVGFGDKKDLSTFAYVVISASAIILLEPVWMMTNAGFCTALLLGLLFAKGEAGRTTVIQCVSIFLLGCIVSVVVYNRMLVRTRLEYEQEKNLREIGLLNEKLKEDAVMDALTGVHNRRFLTEHIDVEPVTEGRECSGALMLDIDRFKRINDELGHQFGDKCLEYLGHTVADFVTGGEDYAVRYGGEEFLLFYYRTDERALYELAEQLRQVVETHRIFENGKEIRFTVSIGMATAEKGMNLRRLIEEADRHLYEAKNSGRNRVCPAPAEAV